MILGIAGFRCARCPASALRLRTNHMSGQTSCNRPAPLPKAAKAWEGSNMKEWIVDSGQWIVKREKRREVALATRHSPATRGFTLMEVLISIGVAAIGILGVLTLLPLAQHQAHQGLQEDRKALAGREGFQNFLVLECNRPQR